MAIAPAVPPRKADDAALESIANEVDTIVPRVVCFDGFVLVVEAESGNKPGLEGGFVFR